MHSGEYYNACISFTHLAKLGGSHLHFLVPALAMLLSPLEVNKYKDLLSLTVENSQERGGKKGREKIL